MRWDEAFKAANEHQAENGGGPREDDEEYADPALTFPKFSDEALALDFAARHRDQLRYVAAWSRWYLWTSTRWVHDDTLYAFDRARALCREAAALCNHRSRKQIGSAKTVAAVASLSRSDRRIAATIGQWDSDPWLLNTPGGVVDLRTGIVRPHRLEDYVTKITAVSPHGGCPLWLSFLHRVTAGDAEIQAYLQRLAGYALVGLVREHVLPFAYGTGGNGKGVFTRAISGAMGDYHVSAPAETFAASAGDRHPTELAMLRGARLVTAQETEKGKRWAEARIKSLTGGDPIPARFMRDFFEFTPQFTLLIAGNHKPGLRSVDEAIRRRFHLIPFTVTIPKDEQDPEFDEKLKVEWPGILAWAIAGCLDWQRQGLNPPEVILAATEKYLEAQDTFASWLEECCVIDVNDWTDRTELFASWKLWAEKNQAPVTSRSEFYDELESRDFHAVKREGTRGFSGLRLQQIDYSEAHWNR